MKEIIPRMRTPQQCVDYFKQQDPESAITYCRILGLAKNGKIPSFRNGRTTLLDLDRVIEYFSEEKGAVIVSSNYGKVRKIN